MCSCMGNGGWGGVGVIEDQRTKRSIPSGPGSSGDVVFYRDPPPTAKYYQRHSQGERPQATGNPVRQSRGQPAMRWLEPVRDGRSVKVHCRR